MDPASRGMDGGWQGIRTRKEFVNLSWCKWNCWQERDILHRWTGVEY
jgi:hypothetical protein